MDTLHEPVKVHPELLLNIQALKEDVHEVGLTTPHATPDIQALLWQGMPTKRLRILGHSRRSLAARVRRR